MDRVEQVGLLREWAGNMVDMRQPGDTSTAQETVNFWLDETVDFDPLPSWFDDHDRALLVRFVDELLAE